MVKDEITNKTRIVPRRRSRSTDFRSLRILVIEPRGRYCKTVWCAIGIGFTHIFIGATVMTILKFYLSAGDHHAILCTVAQEELVRSLRILVIIEPRGRYCKTVWCAIGIGFTHIFIGATVMTILKFYLSVGDLHAILCTVAQEELVRSLHILVIEPRGRYCKTVWCAIGIGFTHISIGATIMTVLMFYLSVGDLHAILCTVAQEGLVRSLRILVIEPRGQYSKAVWWAIGIGSTYIFVETTFIAVLKFYLIVGDLQAILCTVAYHFFSAEAILSLNYANGWSAPLHLRHRRCAHILLQFCAIVCAISGTVLVYTSKGLSGSVHGATGVATAVLVVMAFLTGPCALYRGRYLKLLHTCFGIPTFLLSSISLCSALFTPDFKNWTNKTVIFILIGFITFYSVFILVTCFIKCMMRIY